MADELQARISRLPDAALRKTLTEAVAARGADSDIVETAVGLAEQVAIVSPRERATTPSALADAVREATMRLDPEEQQRVHSRPKPIGLVIASPERLQLLADIAIRLTLLRAPASNLDVSIIEEGIRVWLRIRTRKPVVLGWPSTPTSRAYAALLEELCERIEGDVTIEEGLVDIGLERAPFD